MVRLLRCLHNSELRVDDSHQLASQMNVFVRCRSVCFAGTGLAMVRRTSA